MPYPRVEVKFSSASYPEVVSWVANDSARAQPDIKVILLISWLYGVPVGEVKKDLREMWSAQRQAEQIDRDTPGRRRR